MEYWIGYLDQAVIFGVLAVSLNVLVGYSGIFSVGSAAFAAVGGYATASLTLMAGWDAIPAIALSILFGAVAGTLVSAPILRLPEEYVMLMTMSLSILIVAIVSAMPFLGGAQGLFGIPVPTVAGTELLKPTQFLPWLVGLLLVVGLICWRVGESPYGRLLRASRDNELGVRSLGKSPLPARILAFALMCGLTSLGGALLVLYNGVASASLFSLNQTMLIFAMVIVGGIASIPGSLVGALIIVALQPVLEQGLKISPEDSALIRPIIFGVILVLIMRFRPQGIIREKHRTPRLADVRAANDAVLAPPHPVAATTARTVVPEKDRTHVVLQVTGLTKAFGGVTAVNDLTLQLRHKEITALIGANGAGKSTVFNLITGAIRPDAGTVVLGENDITGKTAQSVARLGMVRSFQDLRVFSRMTPIENVMLAGGHHPGEHALQLFALPGRVRKHDRALAEESASWLEFVGLDPRIGAETGALSFAQQKQVAFARVLATRADILLLDEPLSGIEGQAVDEMLGLVERMRDAGHTICIVEHSVQAISRLADWGYFMETGHVTAEGRIDDLVRDPRLTEAYFGVA